MNYKTQTLERAKTTQLIGALGELHMQYGQDITGLAKDEKYLTATIGLAEANMHLVGRVIKHNFSEMQTRGMENLREECLQEGLLALIEFTRGYDPPTRGAIKPIYHFVREATRAVSRHIKNYINSLEQDQNYFCALANSDGSVDNALKVDWQDPTFDAASRDDLTTRVDQMLKTLPNPDRIILALSCGLWRDIESISQESELAGMEMESGNTPPINRGSMAITNTQICKILHISQPTVKKYGDSALRKMRHHTRRRVLIDFYY